MKVALLSGAYGNVGDLLIESRARKLIEEIIQGVDVNVYSRRDLNLRFDEINNNDVVVFSGGPIYQPNIGANFDVGSTLKLTKPIKILGGGWKGHGRNCHHPNNYKFEAKTLELFRRISQYEGLACRDWYSVSALEENGLKKGLMTGCPAWYALMPHYSSYNDTLITLENKKQVKNICISDPAYYSNYPTCIDVIEYLHSKFPLARMTFALHRGSQTKDNAKIINKINELSYTSVYSMDSGVESFHIYDDCDLHVGFRVHAHIYNLSLRKFSILIEEDGRGAGVNDALGLPMLLAYNPDIDISNDIVRFGMSKIVHPQNKSLIDDLDRYINRIYATKGLCYRNAYKTMEFHEKVMEDYIKSWG